MGEARRSAGRRTPVGGAEAEPDAPGRAVGVETRVQRRRPVPRHGPAAIAATTPRRPGPTRASPRAAESARSASIGRPGRLPGHERLRLGHQLELRDRRRRGLDLEAERVGAGGGRRGLGVCRTDGLDRPRPPSRPARPRLPRSFRPPASRTGSARSRPARDPHGGGRRRRGRSGLGGLPERVVRARSPGGSARRTSATPAGRRSGLPGGGSSASPGATPAAPRAASNGRRRGLRRLEPHVQAREADVVLGPDPDREEVLLVDLRRPRDVRA